MWWTVVRWILLVDASAISVLLNGSTVPLCSATLSLLGQEV